MMRSLYSAVSGLKTHQTKMDVIGNNISNVNTVAFKSSSVTFSSIMYQTLSGASGANAEAGTGGVNAKQIGLGVTTGSTSLSITSAGASETTGLPFDLKITDKSTSSFFVVNNGSENVFTKAGSFYVDGAGNLCMKSTGYTVMGWGVDQETQTIRKDTVSTLKVMSPENMTSEPEATTKARCTGVVDSKNTQVTSSTGSVMNLLVYDNLGYPYTARFSIQAQDTQGGKYAVNLTDIIDAQGKSILSSNISLGELFGPGSGGTAQGSNTDITDNYEFSTGKSKNDINTAIQASAKAKAGTDATGNALPANYTYYFDAADINAQLGLTGKQALPDGYRVRFTSTELTYENALQALKGDTTNGITAAEVYVENASGVIVAKGTPEMINTPNATTGFARSGVRWTFKDGTMVTDANGTSFQATGDSAFTLTKTKDLNDLLSLGTLVTSDEGITGYKFNVEDIRAELGLVEPAGTPAKTYEFEKDSVIYYWPTWSANQQITVTGASGTQTEFKGMVSLESGGDAGIKDIPQKMVGVEELLKDYSYTTITGGDLANATATTGQIFTEQIPNDGEVRYNMFGGNYHIVTPSKDGFTLQFNTVDGTLTSVGGGSNLSQTLNLSKLAAAGYDGFKDVTIDFSALLNYNNGGSNTAAMSGGDADTVGKGKKLGAMTGLSVDQSGKIFASYDNGNTVLLGQISVAQFANASGLEATGDNCYRATLNSGDFDGIGVEIDADGSSISAGELEMSNVDLSGEFTSMITTQRGFQANSRVITTSDSMLEELINLKR